MTCQSCQAPRLVVKPNKNPVVKNNINTNNNKQLQVLKQNNMKLKQENKQLKQQINTMKNIKKENSEFQNDE